MHIVRTGRSCLVNLFYSVIGIAPNELKNMTKLLIYALLTVITPDFGFSCLGEISKDLPCRYNTSINKLDNSIIYNIIPYTAKCNIIWYWSPFEAYHTRTIRCPGNATRIIFYQGHMNGPLQQLVLENCLIYWEDIALFETYFPSWMLNLDNCMDEFFTGDIDYFYKCGPFHIKYVYDLHVSTSVARPVSEAFTRGLYKWPNTKRASFSG